MLLISTLSTLFVGKERWFVVDDTAIHYYKNKKDWVEGPVAVRSRFSFRFSYDISTSIVIDTVIFIFTIRYLSV